MKSEIKYIITNYLISYIPIAGVRNIFYRFLGMELERKSVIYMGLEVRDVSNIKIGKDTSIGHKCILDGRKGIKIGDHVNLSSEVMIWTLQHDMNSTEFSAVGGPVEIGDYAWISARAIILPGRKIGKAAVVAAGAVVTKDVEDYEIVGGVPAKKIGTRNRELNYTVCGKVRFM